MNLYRCFVCACILVGTVLFSHFPISTSYNISSMPFLLLLLPSIIFHTLTCFLRYIQIFRFLLFLFLFFFISNFSFEFEPYYGCHFMHSLLVIFSHQNGETHKNSGLQVSDNTKQILCGEKR